MKLFKNKTELNALRKDFNFLENEFDYKIEKEERQDYYKGKNLIIYRNDNANKQIEICAGNSFFHCIIRKIKNGELIEYCERHENIGFEDLAIIDNPKYDHFDFYAGGKTGVLGVTQNTIGLFKRQKEFLITPEWIDLVKVEKFKDEQFKSSFGIDRLKHKTSLKKEIKQMIYKEHEKFELIFDNSNFPFYHDNSTLEKLIYRFDNNHISIRQVDWRDFPRIFRVIINDNLILEIDTSNVEKEIALEKIKTACNRVDGSARIN